MKLNKASLLRNFILAVVAILCLSVLGVEWMHHHNYGHIVSYGLHVDALNVDADIGIPGQTKM
ncbi:MAG: hypothetical protein ACJ741_13185, partial [Pyrinomonadaceae bacterium]